MKATSKRDVISAAQKAAELTESDTGSVEVQISLLTWSIEQLQQHLHVFAKDRTAHRRLLHKVHKRRSLLHYLYASNKARYEKLIQRLGIRTQRRLS